MFTLERRTSDEREDIASGLYMCVSGGEGGKMMGAMILILKSVVIKNKSNYKLLFVRAGRNERSDFRSEAEDSGPWLMQPIISCCRMF